MKKVTLKEAAEYLFKTYNVGVVMRLCRNGWRHTIVPKTYIGDDKIYTRDKKLAEKKGYIYFEVE